MAENKATITWQAKTGAVGYRVYQQTGDGEPILIAQTQGTSYEVSDLTPPTSQYSFTVSVVYEDCESDAPEPEEPNDPIPPPVIECPAPVVNVVVEEEGKPTTSCPAPNVTVQVEQENTPTTSCPSPVVNIVVEEEGTPTTSCPAPSVTIAVEEEGVTSGECPAPNVSIEVEEEGGTTSSCPAPSVTIAVEEEGNDPKGCPAPVVNVTVEKEWTECVCVAPTNPHLVGYADPPPDGLTFGKIYWWDAVSNAESYNVWRKAPSGEWELVATPLSTQAIIWLPTTGGSQYSIGVSAVCADDCESEITEDVPEPCTCAVPTNVRTEISEEVDIGYQVAILWNKTSAATAYKIWLKSNNGAWQLEATKTSDDTWHKFDTLALPLSNHVVAVSAVCADCESAKVEKTLTDPIPEPEPECAGPSNVKLYLERWGVGTTTGQLNITWTGSTSSQCAYAVCVYKDGYYQLVTTVRGGQGNSSLFGDNNNFSVGLGEGDASTVPEYAVRKEPDTLLQGYAVAIPDRTGYPYGWG
jgi:hypothetical protein